MNTHQAPPHQPAHSGLHCALGKSRRARHHLMAESRALSPPADGLPPQMQVDQICGRRAVVPHQVPHQHIQNVIVDLRHYIF